MALLNLWVDFTKRKNSTKQPPATPTYYKDVKLKEATSIENPVFIVDGIQAGSNYCQYAGHYYYIDDIVYVTNTVVEIHCTKDLLATYKSAIQSSSALVLYYSHNNQEIVDRRLSIKTTQSTLSNTANFDTFGSVTSTTCAYILTVVGKNGTCAYAVPADSLNGLLSQDFFDSLDNNIDDISPVSGSGWDAFVDSFRWFGDLIKTEIGSFLYSDNASNNIKSCFILPLTVSSVGGYEQHIYLGRMDTGKTGLRIVDRIFSDSATVNIPWQATDWRRNAPYHEIFLYIPFIGLTSISPSDVMGETSLTVAVSLDKFSGDTIIEVRTSTKRIAYYTTNLSSPYAIGSSNITPMQSAIAIGSAAAALATSANPAISSITAGLGIVNDLIPTVSCIGSNSGGAMLGVNGNRIICYTVYHDTTVAPANINAELGTPANQVMSLASITGYVQTANASVNMAGHGTDKDDINNLLNGGIYIE